jgi:hypothetical protein
MRSTSRRYSPRRRATAALLVVSLLALPLPSGGAAPPPGGGGEEGAILLRYSAPGTEGREGADGVRDAILSSVPVRWIPRPAPEPPEAAPTRVHPDPSPSDLSSLSERIAAAAERMERAEGAEAEEILAAAEGEARRCHAGAPLLPYLADLYLRRGILALWRGDEDGAKRRFAAARTLMPDFRPDPVLFSPPVREGWERAAALAPLPAVLVVDSVPRGASVRVDGKEAGTTPARLSVKGAAPHLLVLSLPGHRSVRIEGSWLPGDEPSLAPSLPVDALAAVGELLPAEGEAPPAALEPLLEGIAAEGGGARVLVAAFAPAPGEGARARLLSWRRGEPLRDLGFTRPAAGRRDGEEAGREAARLLAGAGWPAPREPREKAWYHRWWFLGAVGAVLAGAVVALAGGGGGGGSGSAVRVDF